MPATHILRKTQTGKIRVRIEMFANGIEPPGTLGGQVGDLLAPLRGRHPITSLIVQLHGSAVDREIGHGTQQQSFAAAGGASNGAAAPILDLQVHGTNMLDT